MDRNNVIERYKNALLLEKSAVQRYWKENGYWLSNIQHIRSEAGDNYYKGVIDAATTDDQISMPEGIRVRLICKIFDKLLQERTGEAFIGMYLTFDEDECELYFSTDNSLERLAEYPKFIRIEPLTDIFIDLVLAKLSQFVKSNALGWKVIEGNINKATNTFDVNGLKQYNLKPSQREAIRDIYQQEVTLVWGPPGTGKTTTLATAICDLLDQGLRILAIAISNVAVDQIALKVLKTRTEFKYGEVIRFGMPRLQEIYMRSILFPNKEKVTKLRERIYNLKDQIKITTNAQDKAIYQRKLNDSQLALKQAVLDSLNHAKLTLTTSAQVLMEPSFAEQKYDVVIIDEGSMMNLPTMAALSLFAQSRLVLAGDYKQLGPIVISRRTEVIEVLNKNAFDAVLEGGKYQNRLSILKTQHRMNEPICELVNSTFYDGVLFSDITEDNRKGSKIKPLPGKALVFVEVTSKDGSESKTGGKSSRFNPKTAEISYRLATKLIKQPNITIGIITPYRSQVQLISREIKGMVKSGKLVKLQAERIKVGTVHAFQGDESDVIIFDLVDTRERGAGALFKHKTGEFLINVGFSRARGKLIVVGDPLLFAMENSAYYPLLTELFSRRHFSRIHFSEIFTA